jgi:exonuclease III
MDLDSIHNQNKSHIDKTTRYMNIYHQNIRGLATKLGELISHLHPHYPHILCITEHHLKQQQIKHIIMENYNLGASYCRNQFEKGGVAIFVHKNIQYSNINIDKYCKETDIEICALKLAYHELKICIITLYRSPTGDIYFFLSKLDRVLHLLHNLTLHIIICGDINIDYLVESERKKQLDNLPLSFNLTSIITFPMRIQNISATAIDNMFLDSS